jgi:hypothetical protein
MDMVSQREFVLHILCRPLLLLAGQLPELVCLLEMWTYPCRHHVGYEYVLGTLIFLLRIGDGTLQEAIIKLVVCHGVGVAESLRGVLRRDVW